MRNITFKSLSPRELDKHRETCPLEIGRYVIKDGIKDILIGPLQVLRIFSQHNVGNKILITPLEGIQPNRNISVVEGSDGVLYIPINPNEYHSITKVNY